MALTQGGFQAYDFNRMVVLFTMMNDKTEVPCAISTDAMDRLEGATRITPEQREQQFLRLRDRIEERASRKFLDVELEGNPPGVILRSIDFRPPPADASRPAVFPAKAGPTTPAFDRRATATPLSRERTAYGCRPSRGTSRKVLLRRLLLFRLRLCFRFGLRLRLFRHIRKHHVVTRRVQIRLVVFQARDDAIDIRDKIAAQPHHVGLARRLLLRGALRGALRKRSRFDP